MKKYKIYVVGIGPGSEEMMTGQALEALEKSDTIIGYSVYLKLLGARFQSKELLTTSMRQETERCHMCFEEAAKGKTVSMICSGDAGIYGMASLMYELSKDYPEAEIEVIAGITAASSGAALLGAPLNHDFCTISLSDQLTPWTQIEKRLIAAAQGDFVMALYNPSSHLRPDHLRHACDILMKHGVEESRACGYTQNIGREGTFCETCTLTELKEKKLDMFTTVFIGNSESEIVQGRLITKRGYSI